MCERVNSNGGGRALSYKKAEESESCPNGLCIAKCVCLCESVNKRNKIASVCT